MFQFQHLIVEKLFYYDFSIPHELLREIIALDRKVMPDLIQILEDAIARPRDYASMEYNKGGMAPQHALMLLKEIQAEEVIPYIICLLQMPTEEFDDIFGGDFLTEDLWEFICRFGKNYLLELESAIYQIHPLSVFQKATLSEGLAQMVYHFPEKRQQITGIYQRLFEFYFRKEHLLQLRAGQSIFNPNAPAAEDIMFLSFVICQLLDANLHELRHQSLRAFEEGIFDDSIVTQKDFYKTPPQQIEFCDIFTLYNIYQEHLDNDDFAPGFEAMIKAASEAKSIEELKNIEGIENWLDLEKLKNALDSQKKPE